MDDRGGKESILECRACQRRRAITRSMIVSFVVTGWPRCCGEVMTLQLEGEDRNDQ